MGLWRNLVVDILGLLGLHGKYINFELYRMLDTICKVTGKGLKQNV